MTARVYVGVAATKGVKVGYSANPGGRLRQVSGDVGETVALAYASEALDNAPAVEAMAHWLLRDHHAGAEWFSVDSAAAIRAIHRAVKAVAAGEMPDRRVANATPFAKLKGARLQLDMSPAEVAALDAWRAERRIWSRSEAIRQLIADGVKAKAEKAKK